MNLRAILFVGLLLTSVWCSCPGNCGDHGNCVQTGNTEYCECDPDWSGNDCSIFDKELIFNVQEIDTIKTFTWHYYHFTVEEGDNVVIDIEQTSRFGDVDAFVQKGSYPTMSDFLASDTTTAKEFSISLNEISAGEYYLGLYGYWVCTVQIQASSTSKTGCLMDCGEAEGKGSCQLAGSTEVCVCNDPYTGDDCSVFDKLVQPGTYTGNVETREMQYYRIPVTANKILNVTVNENMDLDNSDIDLYLRHEARPTWFNFNFANTSVGDTMQIVVSDIEPGTWFIGVYGFMHDHYTLFISISDMGGGCVSQCSGNSHGSCINNECVCNTDYSGEMCENYDKNVQLDTVYNGFVDSFTWNYWKFSVTTLNNVAVLVNQSGSPPEHDCDLFVAEGFKPSFFNSDYSQTLFDTQMVITIEEPSSGVDYWVGIYGYSPCSYTLQVVIPTECACANTTVGTCDADTDTCTCRIGWTGVHCDIPVVNMINTDIVQNSVKGAEWQYYSVTAVGSSCIVALREQGSQAMLVLYLNLYSVPTKDRYICRDNVAGAISNLHHCEVQLDSVSDHTFYIGVYGTFGIRDQSVGYSITAWAPPL